MIGTANGFIGQGLDHWFLAVFSEVPSGMEKCIQRRLPWLQVLNARKARHPKPCWGFYRHRADIVAKDLAILINQFTDPSTL